MTGVEKREASQGRVESMNAVGITYSLGSNHLSTSLLKGRQPQEAPKAMSVMASSVKNALHRARSIGLN